MAFLLPIVEKVANFLFPRGCLVCGEPLHGVRAPTEWHTLCPACASEIRAVGEHVCAKCGVPVYGVVEGARLCASCRAKAPPWDRYVGLVRYLGPVRLWVKSYKYQRAFHLEREFELLIDHYRATLKPFLADAILVPVPLHPLKRAMRGFNQAEELCQLLRKGIFGEEGFSAHSRRHGLTQAPHPPAGGAYPPAPQDTQSASSVVPNPLTSSKAEPFSSRSANVPLILPLLLRTRWTPPQSRLHRDARAQNVKNAFALNPKIPLDGLRERRIVLVDDLLTSGATLTTCAKVLRKAGFTKIDIFTLARG